MFRGLVFLTICKLVSSYDEDIPNVKLTTDYKELLTSLSETIQENFVRAFKNEAVRNQRRKDIVKSVHKLDTILLSLDITKIELSDLKLLWLPDFRVVDFRLNLPKLNIDLDLKLGDLRVEGTYDVNNVELQRLLPVTTSGNVVIDFSEVTCRGRVGLTIQGDSFVPLNYDVSYQWEQTEVTVKYFLNTDSSIENRITQAQDEKSIGNAIWLQLDGILTELLHQQLANVVTEFSVAESLADEDEQLRNFAISQSSRANRIFDSLLCSAKDYVVTKDSRSITTPFYNVVYRGKPTHLEQGTFGTAEGYLQDLSSLTRTEDSSIFEDNDHVFIYGYISLRDFKHGYEKFISKFEGTEVQGSIKSVIYKNKILVKFSEDKNDPNSKRILENVRIKSTNDIDVDTSGLASLSWLVPKVQSWTVGHFRTQVVPVLEKFLEEAFNHAIDAEWRKEHQVRDLDDVEPNNLFWKNVFAKNRSSFQFH